MKVEKMSSLYQEQQQRNPQQKNQKRSQHQKTKSPQLDELPIEKVQSQQTATLQPYLKSHNTQDFSA